VACFPSREQYSPIPEYEAVLCGLSEGPPACLLQYSYEEDDNSTTDGTGVSLYSLNQFYDDFLVLFQVKTTKGILLFLLFCVLSCVCILSICVGSIWIHRLYKRAKYMKSNKLSGSFQFNSQADKAEILMYASNHTSNQDGEDEPQYAEIAEVHPAPVANNLHEYSIRRNDHDSLKRTDSNNSSDDLEATTMTDMTTLPKSGMTTLPSSLGANTLPLSNETDRLLTPSRYRGVVTSGTIGPAIAESTPVDKVKKKDTSMRVSMSETSLTDEIMMALRDRLNDPSLYCTVMDAKAGGVGGGSALANEDLYMAPIYNDPAPVDQTNNT